MNKRNHKNKEILEKLKKYLPEGCTDMGSHVPVRGEGCRYQDVEGKEYLDFSSGIFTNSFGHGCERLNCAGYVQAKKLSNIHGRHSEAELRFYERLFDYLPTNDYKAIPYNDGGYAIDRGLTDIVNYYNKKKTGIGAYRNGFHGKTQAVKLLINETEKATFYDNFLVDFPNCYRCLWGKRRNTCGRECVKSICQTLKERKAGALVFEPVQGAGIIIPPDDYWQLVQAFCKKEGIVMFADEVLTGGGRVGSYLASVHFGIVPDMIALTKGLANGKPLSVLLEREYLTQNPYAVRPMERSSTFAAHPEALAVAAELLQMLREEDIFENVNQCGELLRQLLDGMTERFMSIGEARSLGLMGAIEFVKNRKTKEPNVQLGRSVHKKCRENGLETIGGGHILRLAPPLNINCTDLKTGMEILEKSIAEAERG